MGCFSFLCKVSGKAALSTSFDGSPCYLFLLKDGKVIEEMYGNYDSYGRVFKEGKDESFKWQMGWSDICDLMFNSNQEDGIALILDEHYNGYKPSEQSEDDPNQGWGSGDEDEEEGYLLGDCSSDMFEPVTSPYHKVY